MARLSYDDVDEAFERVVRLASELRIDASRWSMEHGELAHDGRPRSTYRIMRDGRRLFSLGYTRRSAVDALSAAATAFEVVLAEG